MLAKSDLGPRAARIAWLALIAAVAVVPILMRLHMVDLTYLHAPVLQGWTRNFDIYSWWKSVALCALGLIAFIGTALGVKHPTEPPTAVLVFIALGIVSVVASEYPQIAVFGFANHHFGALAVAATLALCWAAASSRFSMMSMGWAIGAAAVIASAHGLCEVYDFEPLQLKWVTKLIVGGYDYSDALGIAPIRQEGMMVASTLYNSNYAGTYAALVTPFLWAFTRAQTKHYKMAIAAFMTLAGFALGVASSSRTGMLGMVVGLALVAWLLRGGYHLARPVNAAPVFVTIFIAIAATTSAHLGDRYTLRKELATNTDAHDVEVFSIENGIVTYKPKDSSGLLLRPGAEGFSMANLAGAVMQATQGANEVTISDPGHPSFTLRSDDVHQQLFLAQGGGYALPLKLTLTGFFLPAWGSLHESKDAERLSFCKHDGLFSARAYIWCRAIPLLKHHVWLGAGPDVFAVELEQRDFKAKMNVFHRPDILVDKPHSFYLQLADGVGIVGTVALLIAMFVALRRMWRVRRPLTVACFCGLVGFLVAGIFNDLYIGVAPVLAVMFGMGAPVSGGWE